MRRVTREASLMAVAAAVMATMVLVGGSAIQPPAEPFLLPDPALAAATYDTSRCIEAPVTAPSASGAVGRATLCPSGRDLYTTLKVDGLTPGAAYTAWLVYTLRPAACNDSPCGPSDLTDGQPSGFTQYVGGGTVPATHSVEIAARLHDIRLVSGVTISLALVSPSGTGGPHARATFIIP